VNALRSERAEQLRSEYGHVVRFTLGDGAECLARAFGGIYVLALAFRNALSEPGSCSRCRRSNRRRPAGGSCACRGETAGERGRHRYVMRFPRRRRRILDDWVRAHH
jgi:hypothetical protein